MSETVAIMVVAFWGGMLVGWLSREQIAWAEWLEEISRMVESAVDDSKVVDPRIAFRAARRREFQKYRFSKESP